MWVLVFKQNVTAHRLLKKNSSNFTYLLSAFNYWRKQATTKTKMQSWNRLFYNFILIELAQSCENSNSLQLVFFKKNWHLRTGSKTNARFNIIDQIKSYFPS